MLTIVILLQMLILVQVANLYTKVEELKKSKEEKDEDSDAEYRRGREWACTEFYRSDCSVEELREKLVDTTGSYIPTDFESGALQALYELKKRKKKKKKPKEIRK